MSSVSMGMPPCSIGASVEALAQWMSRPERKAAGRAKRKAAGQAKRDAAGQAKRKAAGQAGRLMRAVNRVKVRNQFWSGCPADLALIILSMTSFAWVMVSFSAVNTLSASSTCFFDLITAASARTRISYIA